MGMERGGLSIEQIIANDTTPESQVPEPMLSHGDDCYEPEMSQAEEQANLWLARVEKVKGSGISDIDTVIRLAEERGDIQDGIEFLQDFMRQNNIDF